jgi:outer membrane protein assembly factor BamB
LNNRIKAVLIALVVLLAAVLSYLAFASAPSHSSTSNSPSVTCLSSRAPPPVPYATGNLTAGNWTTYHGDDSRAGVVPMAAVTSAHQAWTGPVHLDGDVYAEPLVCGDAVFVATEDDSVYAINATTGGILWSTHLGTPVPGSALPCGDIDPSGITGTPVIDLASRTLYVVAFLSTIQHVLYGLDIDNGSVRSHVVVDAVGSDPHVEQERGALVLANGVVYIPYGGLYGDCGSYHGWVVGVRTDGTGGLLSYQVPTGRAGGIWSPAGITVAPNGNLYVATGNSDATTTFDYGDSVIELSPSLQELSYFAPTNWAQLNSGDTDLGTVAPTVLPNGDVFQVGKEGVGYILSGANLGGIGGQVYDGSVCGSAYGGTAHVGQTVLIPCTDGIVDLTVGASTFSVAWRSSNFDAGSPIVTGNVVWAVNISAADLLGFDLSTGQMVFAFHLGAADHFISPAAAPGSVFVAGGDQLYSFALA